MRAATPHNPDRVYPLAGVQVKLQNDAEKATSQGLAKQLEDACARLQRAEQRLHELEHVHEELEQAQHDSSQEARFAKRAGDQLSDAMEQLKAVNAEVNKQQNEAKFERARCAGLEEGLKVRQRHCPSLHQAPNTEFPTRGRVSIPSVLPITNGRCGCRQRMATLLD